jgi:hypothetical protein
VESRRVQETMARIKMERGGSDIRLG